MSQEIIFGWKSGTRFLGKTLGYFIDNGPMCPEKNRTIAQHIQYWNVTLCQEGEKEGVRHPLRAEVGV